MTAPLPDPGEIVRVLVVDDSALSRRVVVDMINSTPDMTVVAEASNGLEAIRLNLSLQPHLIVMDVTLPVVDVFHTTEIIMRENPTRIVLIGSQSFIEDVQLVSKATAAGALEVCYKPPNDRDEAVTRQFIKTLRAMAHVNVVRRWRTDLRVTDLMEKYPGTGRRLEIVLIVSSTGGPHALETIIRHLPPDFPLPIVIVQHIDVEFVGNMIQWLGSITVLILKMAEVGERPQPGHIYIAPTGFQLEFAHDGRFILSQDTEGRLHIPSGDVLLASAADVYGPNAIGVVLTGMGEDGAGGLLKLRQKGGRTIVQDEASSVVFGMPKAAIERGGSEYVVSLGEIAPLLVKLTQGVKKDDALIE
jgi:two-component system chemotaxis response regulator CheB